MNRGTAVMRVRVLIPIFLLAACEPTSQPASSTTYQSEDIPRLSLEKIRDICDDEDQCALNEVVIAERSPTGAYVIGGLSAGLILTDTSGRFVRRIGRKGKGPGEYGWIFGAKFKDELLYVFDVGLNRLSWFDTAGTFINSTNLPTPPPTPIGLALNGATPYVLTSTTKEDSANIVVHRFNARADTYQPVMSFKGAPLKENGLGFEIPPLFQPRAHFDVGLDDVVYSTNGATYSIRRSGKSESVWTVTMPTEPVTKSDVQRELSRLKVGQLHPQARLQLENAARNASPLMPAVADIKATRDLVWVRRYAKPREDSVRWDAWSLEGRPVGHLVLPASASITSGERHSVIVIGKNDMDVPIVTHFRIY